MNSKMPNKKRYLTVTINIILLMSGFIETIVASFVFSLYWAYASFLDTLIWLVPLVIIFCGMITVLVAVAGCYGCALYSRKSLICFFAIIYMLAFVEIGVSICWLLNRPKYHDYVSSSIQKAFAQTIIEDRRFEWITLQLDYQCCGIDGAEDYVKSGFGVPISCDRYLGRDVTPEDLMKTGNCTTVENSHSSGCKERLLQRIVTFSIILCVTTIFIGLIKLCAALFTILVSFEDSKYEYDDEEPADIETLTLE